MSATTPISTAEWLFLKRLDVNEMENNSSWWESNLRYVSNMPSDLTPTIAAKLPEWGTY